MLALLACFVIVITGVVAFSAGAALGDVGQLRRHGLTKDSVKLYHRAFKLLNRISRVTDLDGDFAADVLSTKTRADIESLLNDYRKDLEN